MPACHRSDKDKDKRAAEKRARVAAKKRYRARLTDSEAKVIREREAAARRQKRAAQSPAEAADARAAHAAVEARRRAAQSPAQATEAELRTLTLMRGGVRPSPPPKQPRPKLITRP